MLAPISMNLQYLIKFWTETSAGMTGDGESVFSSPMSFPRNCHCRKIVTIELTCIGPRTTESAPKNEMNAYLVSRMGLASSYGNVRMRKAELSIEEKLDRMDPFHVSRLSV